MSTSPETPDFAAIARALSAQFGGDRSVQVALIAEQLRQVWNARGAADLVALEPIVEKLGDAMDPDNARVFVGDAIKELDR